MVRLHWTCSFDV